MKWQQKHNALLKTFGAATLSYKAGRFTAVLEDGWVFVPGHGVIKETAGGKTASEAVSNLFEKMAHPVKGEWPGNMDGSLLPKKWSAHQRKFIPVF